MNTYTTKWNERKKFLFSSTIIGAALAILFLVFFIISNGPGSRFALEDILFAFLFFLVLVLIFTPLILVGRLVFSKNSIGGSFATNTISGLFYMAMDMMSGGYIRATIGVFMFVLFGALFLLTVAIYVVYLPVSTIYFYVMYKKEHAMLEEASDMELDSREEA